MAAYTNDIAGKKDGNSIHARRFVAYLVLIIVTFICLFWFYILFINATRSNSELSYGFRPVPSSHFLENWKNLKEGTMPIFTGMFNSLFIAVLTATLATYFSNCFLQYSTF